MARASSRSSELRPGVYTVTFTLPGFSTVKRDNIELTSDFTATVNADMKVGGVEETITVAAESPIVDVQSITQRTVMTREVIDAMPTGRNIQAVGIMIPGTSLALGGGGALSRDVGGSGNAAAVAAAVPRIGRHGADHRRAAPEQPVRAGRLQRRLLERRQLPGNQLRDRRRLRRDGPGRHARQHGARRTAATRSAGIVFGNYAELVRQLRLAESTVRSNLAGDLTYNPNNRLTNVDTIQKIWDFNPSIGGPIKSDKIWFNYTFRHWGVNKTVADSYFDKNPSPFIYEADLAQPGIDDGHIVSNAGRDRVAGEQQGQDLGLPRRAAEIPQSLGHRGRRFRPKRRPSR